MKVAKRPGAGSTTGRKTHISPFEGGKGQWLGSETSQDPAEILLRPCFDPQPFQPPTPSQPPRYFQTRPSYRPGRVVSTCSLKVLYYGFFCSGPVSLTMPGVRTARKGEASCGTAPTGSVRLNLLGRLSLSPFGDFRAQKQLLSGIDRTSTGDEAGSTTGKF